MQIIITLFCLLLSLVSFTTDKEATSKEIRITTYVDNGVVVLPKESAVLQEPVVLGGPTVSIKIPPGATVSLNDDYDSGIMGRRIPERDWSVFEGNYTITIEREGELETTLKVKASTVVIGQFRDNSEGFFL